MRSNSRAVFAALAFLLSPGPALAADGAQYYARHAVSVPSSSTSAPESPGTWVAGEWFDDGICRADHVQIQRREYMCTGAGGVTVPDSRCSGLEPSGEIQRVNCIPKIDCVLNASKRQPAGKLEVLGAMSTDIARGICAEKVLESKMTGICSRDGAGVWRFHEGFGVYSGTSGYLNFLCDAS